MVILKMTTKGSKRQNGGAKGSFSQVKFEVIKLNPHQNRNMLTSKGQGQRLSCDLKVIMFIIRCALTS